VELVVLESQLARHYVNSFSQKFELGWWINAETPETIIKSYVNLAKKLEIPKFEGKESSEVVASLIALLSEKYYKWVLVLDNVEEDHANLVFQKFIPQTGGVAIITSHL